MRNLREPLPSARAARASLIRIPMGESMSHPGRAFGPFTVLVFVLLAVLVGVSVANAQVTVTFDTPGTTNWTVPTGVTSITVEAWGGGGGGGGLGTSSTNARGGGGGAYAQSLLAVTPGDNYTLTVGAGGAGGAAGANPGSAGGASTFGSGPLVRAAGGSLGSAATSGAGGLGGTVAASVGDILFRGGNANSGGGGGAGSTGPGGDAVGTTGGAGTTVGGGDGGSAATSGNSAGANGSAYGGGGSGARRQAGSARAGGAGAPGAVRITYSPNPPEPPPGPVCAVPKRDGDVSASGILNSYFPPSTTGVFGPSSWTIGLGTGRGAAVDFAPGDLALVIQMQCATISATNDGNYGGDDGTGRGYADPSGSCLAGRYEYVRAGAATTAGSLDLSETPLQGVYVQDAVTSANRRTFQVIRVPQYGSLTLSGTVTAEYWDGATGGVVALDVADGLAWSGQTIDVTGRGFRGAGAWQWSNTDEDTNDPPDWLRVFNDTNALRHGHKGEGIAGTPRLVHNQENGNRVDLGTSWGGYGNGDTARGAPGNAGGGGNNRNSTRDNGGGGGGGNGGTGGFGGYGWKSAGWNGVFGTGDFDMRGIGGAAFASPAPDRVVMGGGGGAGGTNNDGNTNPRAKGGAGGGIVIVRAGNMTGGGTVNARGVDGQTMPINDAAGGAGAGGSVVLMSYSASGLGTVTVDVRGGRGGDSALDDASTTAHAGGGGGAGGVVIRSHAATVETAGGDNGITRTEGDPVGGVAHGATPGGEGVSSQQADSNFLVLPGALCPPTAVVLGNVELVGIDVDEALSSLGVPEMSRDQLQALLAVWNASAGAALTGAEPAALISALRDYLDPDGDGRAVVFRWETLEERGTVGFFVDRWDGQEWTRINQGLLPALVAAPMGAQYWLVDPGARAGEAYEYRLIELEARGNTRVYGPFGLQAGD